MWKIRALEGFTQTLKFTRHEHKKTPPVRPITSGSGSLTEGIATFVQSHIKNISTKHQSYLKDTPDFLRLLENINKGLKLDKQAILATLNVDGLFTNITHDDGLKCTFLRHTMLNY